MNLLTNKKRKFDLISHIIIFFSLLYLIYLINNQVIFQPDVNTYISISNSMEHLYDTKFREPFIIWLIKIFYTFENEFILRLSIGLFFILSIYCLKKLLEKLNINELIKYLGLCSYSFNIYLLNLPSTALRDIPILFFIIFFCLFLFCYLFETSKKNLIFLSIACIFLPLIKIYFFLAIVIILLMVSVFNKFFFKNVFFIILLSFLFLTPYLIYCKNKYEDAFHSLNIHVQYINNSEKYFISKNKEIPSTKEELRKEMPHGLYEGEKIGVFKHIFGQNNLINLSKKVIQGNFEVIINRNYQLFSKYTINFIKSKYVRGSIFLIFFIIPILIGMFSLILSFKRKSFLVFSPFVFSNFSVISAFWIDPRIYSFYYIFISIWWSVGLNNILIYFKEKSSNNAQYKKIS